MILLQKNGEGEFEEVTSVVPPSPGFEYWTIYLAGKTDGFRRCVWMHKKEIDILEMRDDSDEEEVEEKNVIRNNQMPSVLREYRDITE